MTAVPTMARNAAVTVRASDLKLRSRWPSLTAERQRAIILSYVGPCSVNARYSTGITVATTMKKLTLKRFIKAFPVIGRPLHRRPTLLLGCVQGSSHPEPVAVPALLPGPGRLAVGVLRWRSSMTAGQTLRKSTLDLARRATSVPERAGNQGHSRSLTGSPSVS